MNLDLRTYSTFKIGGTAHKVFEITKKEDVREINLYTKNMDKPLIIIGEGSNSIFAETTDQYVIGLMRIKGITSHLHDNSKVLVVAQGGESWDDLVAWTVEHNLCGIEALSGIPGTVGAAPVQNIGAYGAELADVFIEAEVYDLIEQTFKVLSKHDCEFTYRDSVFKKNPKRFVITSITIELSVGTPDIPTYKVIQEYFANSTPTLFDIRNAIIKIRDKKIPNYKIFPNCGSFFKNPIINISHGELLIKKFPHIPYFKVDDKYIKLYAGWLIEQVDYQSAQNKRVIFDEANKLILLNNDNATFKDLTEVINNITKLVEKTFNIVLEPEPNFFM